MGGDDSQAVGGALLGIEAAGDPTRFAFAHDHAVVRGTTANAAAYALAAALTLVKAGRAEGSDGETNDEVIKESEGNRDRASWALHQRRKVSCRTKVSVRVE